MRILLAMLLLLAAGASGAEELDARLAATAASLRGALPENMRADALFPFQDGEREDIRFAPLLLEGARHGALPEAAASLTEQLLALSLSAGGLETARLIRRNERVVAKQDAASWVPRFVVERMRDPGRYFLALFGDPDGGTPWSFRYEGHHLSLNVTVAPGRVPATTPLFLGAQPRVVPAGEPDAGAAVLGEEEAAARALLAALPAPLRARATLPYAGDRSLMLGQVRRVSLGGRTGVARGEMPPEAQAQLDRLVEGFIALFASEIAAARRAELDAAGRDALRFAWAEAAEPPGAFYLRIQGPRTLIELDNTTDGDHVHAVWHDVPGDFGADLLAAHYRREHGSVLTSLCILQEPALLDGACASRPDGCGRRSCSSACC
jgi:hypothetical protein